jgi:RNA polymerase sigma factor (sigma-70 family)
MGAPVDAESFAREAADLYTRLCRVAYLLGGDRGLAEECAQEALARAWQRVDRGATLDSLEAWTTTVALNWCRSQLRRRGAEARAVAVVAQRAEPTTDDDRAAGLSTEVRDAVVALPFRQREVVVLHYLLGYDVAAIAAVAGISTGAVKNALFHARASLAEQLGRARAGDEVENER